MDQCHTIEEITALLDTMIQTFAEQVFLYKQAKEEQLSPAVLQGMDYISYRKKSRHPATF